MKRLAASLIAFLVWCPNGLGAMPFKFAILSDIHTGATEAFELGEPADNFKFAMSNAPAFVLFLGDLTKYATSNHFQSFSNLCATNITVPWYAIPGNHDAHENGGYPLDYIYWDMFMGTNKHFSLSTHGIRFIAFLSERKENMPDAGLAQISTNECSWIESELIAATNAHQIPILCSHAPLLYAEVPAGYGTSMTFGGGAVTNWCRQYNVHYVLSGHLHSTNKLIAIGNWTTNVLVPSVRDTLDLWTSDNDIPPIGGALDIVTVTSSNLQLERFECSITNTYASWGTTLLPLENDWSGDRVATITTLRTGTVRTP